MPSVWTKVRSKRFHSLSVLLVGNKPDTLTETGGVGGATCSFQPSLSERMENGLEEE